MARSRFEEDDELEDIGSFDEELADEDGELDDFDDDELTDELDDEKLEDLAEKDDEEDDDDEDEEGLDVNKETEDWSESIDDMESDYWEDYTRGPR